MSLQNSIRFQYVFISHLTKHLPVIVSILTRHAFGTYIESHTGILFTKNEGYIESVHFKGKVHSVTDKQFTFQKEIFLLDR